MVVSGSHFLCAVWLGAPPDGQCVESGRGSVDRRVPPSPLRARAMVSQALPPAHEGQTAAPRLMTRKPGPARPHPMSEVAQPCEGRGV